VSDSEFEAPRAALGERYHMKSVFVFEFLVLST